MNATAKYYISQKKLILPVGLPGWDPLSPGWDLAKILE